MRAWSMEYDAGASSSTTTNSSHYISTWARYPRVMKRYATLVPPQTQPLTQIYPPLLQPSRLHTIITKRPPSASISMRNLDRHRQSSFWPPGLLPASFSNVLLLRLTSTRLAFHPPTSQLPSPTPSLQRSRHNCLAIQSAKLPATLERNMLL